MAEHHHTPHPLLADTHRARFPSHGGGGASLAEPLVVAARHPAPTAHHLGLAATLNRMFAAQRWEVGSRLTLDSDGYDLGHWDRPMADAARPYVLAAWRVGSHRFAQALAGRAPPVARKAAFRLVDQPPPIDRRILRAVDDAALKFCRETNETATRKLAFALAELRRQLKIGLSRGEAVRELAKRVRRLFADPRRAHVIAATESARATNLGRLQAAQDSGLKLKKRWILGGPNPCEECRRLARRKAIPLDRPFRVDPKGGPYAVTMVPPGHPGCWCDWVESFAA